MTIIIFTTYSYPDTHRHFTLKAQPTSTAQHNFIMPSSQTLAISGIVLCIYALYVEYKTAHPVADEEFSALCDIAAIGASCSAVLQLPQSHLVSYLGLVSEDSIFNIPNAALGAVYYVYHLVLRTMLPWPLTVGVTSAAMTYSLFLAYHLTLLSELCILCWTTHIINAFLLYNTLVKLPKELNQKKEVE